MPTNVYTDVNSSSTGHQGFCEEESLEGRKNSLDKHLPSNDLKNLNSNTPPCNKNKMSDIDKVTEERQCLQYFQITEFSFFLHSIPSTMSLSSIPSAPR